MYAFTVIMCAHVVFALCRRGIVTAILCLGNGFLIFCLVCENKCGIDEAVCVCMYKSVKIGGTCVSKCALKLLSEKERGGCD